MGVEEPSAESEMSCQNERAEQQYPWLLWQEQYNPWLKAVHCIQQRVEKKGLTTTPPPPPGRYEQLKVLHLPNCCHDCIIYLLLIRCEHW